MQKLVLATSNRGKIKELSALLPNYECISQSDLAINSIAETGTTFIENALLKARHASSISGHPALADDSGLVIPKLKGEPGIYSARYAGDNATDNDNINLVLANLTKKHLIRPQAYFYCALVLLQHANDPAPNIAVGQLHGEILSSPTGSHGFGYDPIFFLPEYNCSLAELDSTIKNTISHRAQALIKLINE